MADGTNINAIQPIKLSTNVNISIICLSVISVLLLIASLIPMFGLSTHT
ncbi:MULTISPECIES: hypothetical protein [Clostridium]|nr:MULTISPECIES: hypothetical protein [Clostridium]